MGAWAARAASTHAASVSNAAGCSCPSGACPQPVELVCELGQADASPELPLALLTCCCRGTGQVLLLLLGPVLVCLLQQGLLLCGLLLTAQLQPPYLHLYLLQLPLVLSAAAFCQPVLCVETQLLRAAVGMPDLLQHIEQVRTCIPSAEAGGGARAAATAAVVLLALCCWQDT